jgi:hypothetical protein
MAYEAMFAAPPSLRRPLLARSTHLRLHRPPSVLALASCVCATAARAYAVAAVHASPSSEET